MRLHGPPMNSGSVVSSITSTLPCAGETIALGMPGASGFGSRKKQRVNRTKTSHTPTSAEEMAAFTPPSNVASTPAANSAISRTRVQKMIRSAARKALPECFICRGDYSARVGCSTLRRDPAA